MKKLTLVLAAILSLSAVNGCTLCEPEVVYKCPRLQTYEVNATELAPLTVDYEVRNG